VQSCNRNPVQDYPKFGGHELIFLAQCRITFVSAFSFHIPWYLCYFLFWFKVHIWCNEIKLLVPVIWCLFWESLVRTNCPILLPMVLHLLCMIHAAFVPFKILLLYLLCSQFNHIHLQLQIHVMLHSMMKSGEFQFMMTSMQIWT
jgi:hypothetical protein